ncbi:collagenase [Streptomyces sp. NPDC051578]|uniref:collagenase n=1 Tax=Streptomyces sp. NPDC051578 TaxID=3365662 RepID=UPI00379DB812
MAGRGEILADCPAARAVGVAPWVVSTHVDPRHLDVWWGEGIAEYISSLLPRRHLASAVAEAGKHTYTLRTLFDTTYANSDVSRTYDWGYLAARYMVEKHPADVSTVLGYYRAGDWTAARSFLTSLDYESDWNAWLTAVAAGA